MEKIMLRPISDTDRDSVISILLDEQVCRTYMLPAFSSPEEAVPLFERLKDLSNMAEHYVRGICLGDLLIGFLNDTQIVEDTIELGWVVHPVYQNRGFGTQAVKLAIADLFQKGFHQVIAGAFSENSASIRVMEKCGMRLLDKTEEIEYRGSRHHCVYYGSCSNVEENRH